MAGRLLMALLAGLLLGIPYAPRHGSVRAHLMVTVGAALFCVTAQGVGERTGEPLLRVVQGVASGVGFVGAASVLKKGTEVTGLTEAASIWIAAAVGCGVILGDPWRTVGAALLVFLANVVGGFWEGRSPPDPKRGEEPSRKPQP